MVDPRSGSRTTAAWIYPAVVLSVLLSVVWGLDLVLWKVTERQAFALLREEGMHLAASIRASTLHGLRRVHLSQAGLLDRLKATAAWLDTTLTGDPRRDGPLIAQLSEREDLDLVALYDEELRPIVWTEPRHPRGPRPIRWFVGPPPDPLAPSCPEACGPLIGLLAQLERSGETDRAFDLWRWRHGWRRPEPSPVGYARRRVRGGFVFLRASPDLTRRTLDVESFQALLENLSLTKKVREVALTDDEGVILFANDRSRIGTLWQEPDPANRFLVVREPFPMGVEGTGTLWIVLTTDDARQILSTTKRNLSVLSMAASAVGMIGVLAVFALERRHRARVEAMRDALHAQERLADLGRMAAGVAHEIRNPLNALGLMAQRIARTSHGNDPSLGEMARLMRQEIARLDRTVEAITAMARPSAGPRGPVDLVELVHGIAALYESEASERGVRIVTKGDAPVYVEGNPDRLHQALGNLVRNAIDVAPPGTEVTLSVDTGDGRATLVVEDEGPGFSPEVLSKALDAFYSTKPRGLGLGLTLASQVVHEHGGTLRLLNRQCGGGRVEVLLPISKGAS